MDNESNDKDKMIFIIPYKNREQELQEWLTNMIPIMNFKFGHNNWEVLVIHQIDNRLFNKGALVNSGYKICYKKYGTALNNMKLTMNDVDIYPRTANIFSYYIKDNELYHPYGEHNHSLSPILGCFFTMYFKDYKKVNGIPNYWGWGNEDVCFARRCEAFGIHINEEPKIERRSNSNIIDKPSIIDSKKLKFMNSTNIRNYRETVKENHTQPINGISNLKLLSYNEHTIPNFESFNNIRMYDIEFEIL